MALQAHRGYEVLVDGDRSGVGIRAAEERQGFDQSRGEYESNLSVPPDEQEAGTSGSTPGPLRYDHRRDVRRTLQAHRVSLVRLRVASQSALSTASMTSSMDREGTRRPSAL